MKNIDTAFRYTKMVSLLSITVSFLICCFTVYYSTSLVKTNQQKVYVLANGKILEAFASQRKDNILVEAKDHIATFHLLFFNLSPDDRAIEKNVGKALYLADGSAKKMYDDLKEKNYFSSIISGNVSQELNIDSISVNLNIYPFQFILHGTQTLTRPTSTVTRTLICKGALRNVARSENVPHGFLIEDWAILDNRDIDVKNR